MASNQAANQYRHIAASNITLLTDKPLAHWNHKTEKSTNTATYNVMDISRCSWEVDVILDLTSPATLESVSRPNCRSEMNEQCAQRRRKRRHVRFTASCLTLASSKDIFLRIIATCSTRWPSMSPIPMLRCGWNSVARTAQCSKPSEKKNQKLVKFN